MNKWLRISAVAAGLILSACSTVPKDVGGAVDESLTIARVRGEPSLAQGQLVRWGGLVARVQNKENQTWIEIVEKPLGGYGQPVDANITNGRFIAIFDRFLDPMIFQTGREITVMGSVQPAIDGKIDEQPYKYVVIAASGYHLWQPRVDRHYDDVILLHRGWWDPWWYRPVYIHHHHHVSRNEPRYYPTKPTQPRIVATTDDSEKPRPTVRNTTITPTKPTTRPPRIVSDDDEPPVKGRGNTRDKKSR